MIKDEQNLFIELNDKLKKEELSLSLICVGGFVLDYYGIRGTIDIDAFYNETNQIKKIIYEIGEKHDLNTQDELWINNSVQNLNKRPPESICKTIYNYSNLKILIPPLEYIAGMKLKSGRENDIEDVASIIKVLKIKDIKIFKEKLSSYNFGDFDDALIIESFGIAFGMDWLKEYYLNHENELIDSINNNNNNQADKTKSIIPKFDNEKKDLPIDGLRKAFERFEEDGSCGICGDWKVEKDLSSSSSLWSLSYTEEPIALCVSTPEHDYITRLDEKLSDKSFTEICEIARSFFPNCKMSLDEQRLIEQRKQEQK